MNKIRPTITNIFIATIVAGSLFNWATQAKFLKFLALNSEMPHTVFTYAFLGDSAGSGFLWTILSLFMIYTFGGEIERSLGAKAFALLAGILAAVGGLGLIVGAGLLGAKGILYGGPFLMVTCLFTYWAMRSPNLELSVFGLIKAKAKILVVVYAVLTIVSVGGSLPALGLFALLPLGLAALMGTGTVPVPLAQYGTTSIGAHKNAKDKKREQAEFDQFITKVRDKAGEREDKERLRKLFENSLKDDPEDRQAK